MQLCKFFKVMGIVIVLALAYIHMQMQIVDLAYQGNKKEQEIRRLVEENGSATYKILMMKSANHLGLAMLKEDSDMQFADARDVVKIAASDDILRQDDPLDQQQQLAKQMSPLLSLLSLGVEAEAKTAE